MVKKRRQGHYCKICGEIKSNESFSGKGHAVHICKACAGLPIERKNELQRINRVAHLMEKFRLSREEWDLLEKYAKNRKYPELREFATEVLQLHQQRKESRKPQIEEIIFTELEEEVKEEIREILYDDLTDFIVERDVIPDNKQLQKITSGICKAYLTNFYMRIIPDNELEKELTEVLSSVTSDLRDEGFFD